MPTDTDWTSHIGRHSKLIAVDILPQRKGLCQMRILFSSTDQGTSGAITTKMKPLAKLAERAIEGGTIVASIYIGGIPAIVTIGCLGLVWMLKDI